MQQAFGYITTNAYVYVCMHVCVCVWGLLLFTIHIISLPWNGVHLDFRKLKAYYMLHSIHSVCNKKNSIGFDVAMMIDIKKHPPNISLGFFYELYIDMLL